MFKLMSKTKVFLSYSNRHIGNSLKQLQDILNHLKIQKMQDVLPTSNPSIFETSSLQSSNIPYHGYSQQQMLQHMQRLFKRNMQLKFMIGYIYYNTIMPNVIKRNLFQNPSWYTAYTPYQPQILQGRLYSLMIFQTMIADLTGLPKDNSSLLDQASQAAQSLLIGFNLTNKKKCFIHSGIYPYNQNVLRTVAKYQQNQIIKGDQQKLLSIDPSQLCAAIFQSPDKFGLIRKFSKSIQHLKKTPCLRILGSDLFSLCLTQDAGSLGFNICYGNSQRFGVPMGYGGPSAAFFAFDKEFMRKIPGRIVGQSIDSDKNKCYRMALQTRQQHIRRQKATSNICTAQVLLANISAMYAVYHGPQGLKQIALRMSRLSKKLATGLVSYGLNIRGWHKSQYNILDTICIDYQDSKKLSNYLQKLNICVNKFQNNALLISVDQTTQQKDIDQLLLLIAKFFNKQSKQVIETQIPVIPKQLLRKKQFLKHPVFNTYHSQTQMMRFLDRLKSKDISLTKSMIPLGSCTMKLNAATAMTPLSWNSLNVHPFTPTNMVQGYSKLIQHLTYLLCQITKFDAVSFQSNSGAQGQYSGLITILRYQQSIGQGNRNICLIPVSAHGTNPASAIKSGLKVVPIQVTQSGLIDMKDINSKIQQYKNKISCLMVTYPSTAGIFDDSIKNICQLIHREGGQVYMDGANMNAQVGLTSPGFLGADVCHLNLHKTFAIPHGGGGPGMGPICVKKHLKQFLPNHFTTGNSDNNFSVSSSQHGSASILSISYSYILMLGKKGLKDSSLISILNANYLKSILKDYYIILYGQSACAHQFLIDLRPLKASHKITDQDVAKRLIDYGFHAPTISFPVSGTVMIQPTQSQDKGELDRFAQAMINIRKQMDKCPQILKNAPHTAQRVCKQQWKYPYTRQQAAYPLRWIKERGKYWPPVGRIDGAYGDRNIKTILD